MCDGPTNSCWVGATDTCVSKNLGPHSLWEQCSGTLNGGVHGTSNDGAEGLWDQHFQVNPIRAGGADLPPPSRSCIYTRANFLPSN